jgi:hypothetical protein
MEIKETEVSTSLAQKIKELKTARKMFAILSTCFALTLLGELGYSAAKGEIDFNDETTISDLLTGEDWNNVDWIGITALDTAAALGATLISPKVLNKKRKMAQR